MNVRGRVAALALAVLTSSALAVSAQQVFHAGTDTVLLSVTVTDAAKHPVGGLPPEVFHVVEDGVVQPISVFSHDPEPIALSILIDTSASMEHRLSVAQQAAIGFTRRLGPRDVAQVIAFDSIANVLQTFTSDQSALERAIRRTQTGDSTSLYTALYVALTDLQAVRAEAAGEIRRQAIVVLSDGDDTSSLVTDEAVLDLASRAGVTVYAIGLRSKEDQAAHGYNEADHFMRTIADNTGGRVYFVDTAQDLPAVYQQIADELATQYVIGYTSTNRRTDGAWRRVVVTVDRPGAHARTRSGYYGPKVPR